MKCPICNDNLVPVKLSPGTFTHEYQTDCAFVWNDLTVPQIEVLRDAALGAAVRRMPNDHVLQRSDWQGKEKWFLSGYECPDGCRGELRTRGRGDTPEAALIAAGLMKGEK